MNSETPKQNDQKSEWKELAVHTTLSPQQQTKVKERVFVQLGFACILTTPLWMFVMYIMGGANFGMISFLFAAIICSVPGWYLIAKQPLSLHWKRNAVIVYTIAIALVCTYLSIYISCYLFGKCL